MARCGGRDLPHAGTRPSAKASRHGARAKEFAPRRNVPHGEGLPTRRTSERICPAGFAFAPRADERRAALDRRTAGKTPLRRGRTRDGARAKGFVPRRNTPHGEGLPTRHTGERICPAQEHSPRRRPPDTAHGRKDLPRAGTLPTAKTSRNGARAKGFAPRRNALRGEGLPTRRTSERICAAREGSPRRRLPDTAHGRKDLCRAGTRPTAKASRHGARAKGFVPRRNALLGESLPTRREGEGICPAQEHAPRRRHPDTAHERKGLPRGNAPLGEGLPTRRASERICPAREGSPRRRPPDTAHEQKNLFRGSSRSPHVPTNGGPPSVDGQPKNTPSAGSHPQRAAAAEFIHLKK